MKILSLFFMVALVTPTTLPLAEEKGGGMLQPTLFYNFEFILDADEA